MRRCASLRGLYDEEVKARGKSCEPHRAVLRCRGDTSRRQFSAAGIIAAPPLIFHRLKGLMNDFVARRFGGHTRVFNCTLNLLAHDPVTGARSLTAHSPRPIMLMLAAVYWVRNEAGNSSSLLSDRR